MMNFAADRALVIGITNLGDVALLLPLAAVMFIWLASQRSWRRLLSWLMALALCMGGVALLKIYFFACPPLPSLHSPSGHTGLSTLVYGAFSFVAAARAGGWRRAAIIAAGLSLVTAIALTRLILGVHSLAEVVLGMAIGSASLAVFASGYLRERTPVRSLSWLMVAALVVIVFFRGDQLHAEELLRAISRYLHVGRACA